MTGLSDRDAEKERLEWEFELLGRGAFNWILSAMALLSAADLTYERYTAAAQLHGALTYRDASGVLRAVERPLSASEVDLLPETRLGPVAIMLLGLGLENLTKGLMIHASPELVSRDRGIHQQLKSHKLEDLVAACADPSHVDERRALGIISQFVNWAGRYPIPTKPVGADQAGQNMGFWARHQLAPIEWLWEHATAVRLRLTDKVKAEFPQAAV